MRLVLAVLFGACVLASSAFAQTDAPRTAETGPSQPGEAAPNVPVPPPERAPDGLEPDVAETTGHQVYPQRMPYRHTLRVRPGEVRVEVGRLRANQPFVSIPVEHRRTFVTLETAEEGRVLLQMSRLVVPMGTRGYLAEGAPVLQITESYPYTYYASYYAPVYCFFIEPDQPHRTRCMAPNGLTAGNSGLVEAGYTVSLPQPGMNLPRVEFQPIVFAEDMRLEYELRPWTISRARIAILINGRVVQTIQEEWSRSGAADFELPVGILHLEKDGNHPGRATATLTPYTADNWAPPSVK